MAETGQPARPPAWRKWARDLLILAIILIVMRVWQQRDMPEAQPPALQAITLEGKPYNLPRHPERPLLVHFWASWCPICRVEQDSIAAIARDHPGTLTLAMQSGKPDEVAQYLKQLGVNYPVVNDPDGTIAASWGVHSVPASFIIAPDGSVRFIEIGYTSEIGLRLRLWLAGII